MAKLLRKVMKVFGSSAGANQIAEFGSLAAGTPTFTTDPATVQSLGNYLTGWFGAVIGGSSPAIEDMNAVHFLFAYQLAYLMQQGTAEWDATTTYFKGSLVNSGGSLYISLIDTNLNQALTDTTKWKLAFAPSAGPDILVGNLTTFPWATHATLAAAVADANQGINKKVLLLDSQTLASPVTLSKVGWRISALPGVTYDGPGTGFNITVAGVEVERVRFASFTTAVLFGAAAQFNRVLNCNFATSIGTEIDDNAVLGGRKPVVIGNITEV